MFGWFSNQKKFDQYWRSKYFKLYDEFEKLREQRLLTNEEITAEVKRLKALQKDVWSDKEKFEEEERKLVFLMTELRAQLAEKDAMIEAFKRLMADRIGKELGVK